MAGEIGDYCGIDFIGGGLGAVDKIDGAVLQDKDHFLVVTPTVFAPLSLDADSGAGENSPQIIAPNTNPGTKRWVLTGGVFANLTVYGKVGIGTTTPLSTNGGLDISSGGLSLVIGADNAASSRTNVTEKDGRLCCAHYTNAEEPLGILLGTSGVNYSYVFFGGGSGIFNAATEIRLYTAANTTTLIGTSRMTVKTDGKIGINDNEPGSQFDVNGDVNTTENYKVDDVQVVSNQGAVVADATDPATTMARLNDLLARCRAHGLIAT